MTQLEPSFTPAISRWALPPPPPQAWLSPGPCHLLAGCETGEYPPTSSFPSPPWMQLGDPTLNALEIWGAEYQESNALLLRPRDRDFLSRVSARERCPVCFVGTITGDRRVSGPGATEAAVWVGAELRGDGLEEGGGGWESVAYGLGNSRGRHLRGRQAEGGMRTSPLSRSGPR